jgi:hypothetical protein
MTFGFRNSLLVAAGVAALLVGLVTLFPARLALAWFAPPGIVAWGIEGTVWRGRATELALGGRSLGRLSWSARPARLLALTPTWDIELNRPEGFFRARAGSSLFGDRQQIRDLEAAVLLQTLPPALVPNGTAGQARISLSRLDLEHGWPTAIVGQAAVNALDLPGVIVTLGPFEFTFPDTPGTPVGEIRSLGGPLAVDGRIELPAPGRWQFSAELGPGENPPRELIEGLAFVGEDLGGGRRRLELSSEP